MEWTNDMPACFRMLEANRVEMVFSNEVVGWASIDEAGLKRDNFKTIGDPFVSKHEHLMVSAKAVPDSEKLMAEFDRELQKLNNEGVIKDLWLKHLQFEMSE
jgi:ABC-type amino acid transport substrate-binding protein